MVRIVIAEALYRVQFIGSISSIMCNEILSIWMIIAAFLIVSIAYSLHFILFGAEANTKMRGRKTRVWKYLKKKNTGSGRTKVVFLFFFRHV